MTSESFQEPTGPQTGPAPYQGPYIEYGADGPATGPGMPPPISNAAFAWGANQAGNAAPVSLWGAIKQLTRQYWRILRYPGSATFGQEMGKARWDIIWVQVIGLSLLSALFVMLIFFIEFAFLSAIFASMPTPSGGESFPSDFMGLFFLPIPIFGVIALISGIGGYFLSEGITYALAKAFGGQGDFKTQMYSSLLYRAHQHCFGSSRAGPTGWQHCQPCRHLCLCPANLSDDGRASPEYWQSDCRCPHPGRGRPSAGLHLVRHLSLVHLQHHKHDVANPMTGSEDTLGCLGERYVL
jgi:hypothetical protein